MAAGVVQVRIFISSHQERRSNYLISISRILYDNSTWVQCDDGFFIDNAESHVVDCEFLDGMTF